MPLISGLFTTVLTPQIGGTESNLQNHNPEQPQEKAEHARAARFSNCVSTQAAFEVSANPEHD